jgi:uncharacterized membrane protein YbhN (UPF0104 family)
MLLLKAAVLVVVLWFVASSFRTAALGLQKSDWRLDAASLFLSAMLYIGGLMAAGVFWWWLLRRLGQPVRPLDALRAYFVGHLGKYVPGKAMVVVLRAGIVKSVGADVALATIAVLIETLTMMASGAVVSLILIAAMAPPDWKLALAAALAVATGGPTLPPILNRLVRRLDRRISGDLKVEAEGGGNDQSQVSSNEPSSGRGTAAIGWRALAGGWLAMCVLWVFLGSSLFAILSGLEPGVPMAVKPFLLAIAAVALATVAGFLSLLPGGLVVRELILLDLLAPQVGEPTALVAAVLLRLVWLVSELIVSGCLYVATKSH